MSVDINEYIKEQLESIDVQQIVREEIRSVLKEEATYNLSNKIRSLADAEISEIIKVEINKAFQGAVNTDDGWGDKKHFDTFEDLFKSKFQTKLNSDWEVKRTIERTIENKVSEYIKAQAETVTKKVAEVLINNYGKEKL